MEVVRLGPTLQARLKSLKGQYEIEVRGQDYTVHLNGQQVTQFHNTDNYRGKNIEGDPHSGYVGAQSHTGQVRFRNIQVQALEPEPPTPRRRKLALEVTEPEVASRSAEAPIEVAEELVTARDKAKTKTAAAGPNAQPKSA